jgi:hypothetical protein
VRLLFELGRVVSTPAAVAALKEARVGPRDLLARHQSGDWGDLDAFDRRENARALLTGARIFSAYQTAAGKIWILTEADRASTCILRPEDY